MRYVIGRVEINKARGKKESLHSRRDKGRLEREGDRPAESLAIVLFEAVTLLLARRALTHLDALPRALGDCRTKALLEQNQR